MKKYINRNYFWADLFVEQLSVWGIENVCISPGSRNTPLTMAFAGNKKIKSVINVDERSSGFFALGLAKGSGKPVAVVTTSGTAVAELYPAVIEAYYQRIPLIICTADRPEFLRNTGANQTINQENIFRNHIRHFVDFGLPDLKKSKLKSYLSNLKKAVETGLYADPGPVHLNFPFKKPLEPHTFSDKINSNISDFLLIKINKRNNSSGPKPVKLFEKFLQSKRPAIHCGWDNYSSEFYYTLSKFSTKHKIPVLTDGSCDFRFARFGSANVFTNYSSYINYMREEPDLLIQFGNAPTSKQMLDFLSNSSSARYLIDKYGDIKDPSPQKGELIITDPQKLLSDLSKYLNSRKWIKWNKYLSNIEKISEDEKVAIDDSKFGLEPGIINLLLNSIPKNSNIFVSNSLPVRDFDYFASTLKNNFKVYTNRGASGIDGIISTASGIALNSANPTFLIIGDLAFYHNLSALAALDQLKIPLVIILVNNGGGGIFRMLPISETNEYFKEYFLTPQKLDYLKISEAFNGKYYLPKSWKSLRSNLSTAQNQKRFSLLEVRTDSQRSVALRRKYWMKIKELIQNVNEN
jgi:2-succinyl-5-enolpyruvyl-6-hydroxy-3-cyclohexene-1-carboxylate synthase